MSKNTDSCNLLWYNYEAVLTLVFCCVKLLHLGVIVFNLLTDADYMMHSSGSVTFEYSIFERYKYIYR